jgi:hypothetical protein
VKGGKGDCVQLRHIYDDRLDDMSPWRGEMRSGTVRRCQASVDDELFHVNIDEELLYLYIDGRLDDMNPWRGEVTTTTVRTFQASVAEELCHASVYDDRLGQMRSFL